MKNSYKNLVAANIVLDIDYPQMETELLTTIAHNKSKLSELDGVVNGIGYGLLLRNSSTTSSTNLWKTKEADTDSWSRDHTLNIPYTRSVIVN